MVSTYIIASTLSLTLFWGITFLFPKFGIVDKPDGIRKLHQGEISLGGGTGLFLSCTLFLFVFFPDYSIGKQDKFSELFVVWCISVVILLMGFWDDLKPLPTSFRLIIQILSSWLVIIMTDTYLRNFGNLFVTPHLP